jgi:hypothetical protein
MAWIASIEKSEGGGKLQPTQVIAHVKIFHVEGGTPIIQIDTHGSTGRENPGKQSQTIQFGRDVAQQLSKILKDTYGF